jgi:hypothetical protein
LEDKFYELELNHIARLYNETADELAKIASRRTTVPPDVFSRDLHQPSIKTEDTPEPEAPSAPPEAPSAQSEVPSAQSEVPSTRSEVPSAQPEVPSAPEGKALRVEGEQSEVTPNQSWQTPYLQYLHRGELPLDQAEARRLARRAKSFVLLGDGKEIYHRSPSGVLQRCISIAEGQQLLQKIHSGACGHHAAPRTLVGNAFRQGFYWPTAVADATRIVRTCEGCQFYAMQTHLPAQALQTIPITWPFAVWGLDLVGPLQKTLGGYTHLLVAIDKFSKWIEVRPLNSIRSEQAMTFLTNVPVHTQSLVDKEGLALPQQSLTLPRGLKGGNPLYVKIFNQKGFRAPPAMSVAGPQEANMGACEWQGRPSRETPTPLGYGYLTCHLPRKMTLTWASHPATGERG